MSHVGPLWKGLRIAEHLLTGAGIATVVAAAQGLGYRLGWLDAVVCWWYRRLLRCLAVRLHVEGDVAGTSLLVANHVSWLDIPAIGSQAKVRFLSKAEVRRWPLIGWMSELAGTVYLHRGAHRVAEAVADIRAQIEAGRLVAIFPEGTTSDGLEVLRFHPRLFAVCREGLAVQPVALRYGSGPRPDPVAPFLGEEDLLSHLWRMLRQPGMEVRVSFLEPIPASGLDRRRLADRARQAIAVHLSHDRVGTRSRPGLGDSGATALVQGAAQPGNAA